MEDGQPGSSSPARIRGSTRAYRFIVEIQLGIIVSLHRDVMGSSFQPTLLEVTFEPPRPDPHPRYETLFGCPIAFRQPSNRLLFNADWLDETPGFGNEVAYASVLSLCDDLPDRLQNRLGVAGKVRGVLLARLGRNLALEDVATKIEIPERTLRRKLREEGTSFREIADQLRAEVAFKYLRDTEMNIDEIASALGFSEPANFRHAFRCWKRASRLPPGVAGRAAEGGRPQNMPVGAANNGQSALVAEALALLIPATNKS